MDTETKKALIVALYPTIKRFVDGRTYTLWREARGQWIKQHPPTNGGWVCAVCSQFVGVRHMTIDHIVMKVHAPELQLTLTNFQPTHPACNVLRARIMTEPLLMMQMRSEPENHWDKILVERVLYQAQVAYAAWERTNTKTGIGGRSKP